MGGDLWETSPSPPMIDFTTTMVIAVTFTLAGFVKGVIGLGLPTVSLALLTIAIDLTGAMALLLGPSFITNVWQGASGGNGLVLLRRLWLFLLPATATVWIGALALGTLDQRLLSALLGVLIAIYAGLGLLGIRLTITNRRAIWTGPVFGVCNGIATGMTGSFVVPGVMYLQAIGLSKDELIQAMGILFTLSTLALGVSLQNANLLTLQFGIASGLAVIPALMGMLVGQRLRSHLSETAFKRYFLLSLCALGVYIVINAVL